MSGSAPSGMTDAALLRALALARAEVELGAATKADRARLRTLELEIERRWDLRRARVDAIAG